ncbi:hypothetical protein HPP92_015782 [Vanilla planifolia]|uniref:WAT1-related protein n=1 Tax=Vanilla planifolia TaxID=51239 RepID=A0A835UTK7_VANPL|nr:hypothetical protein HPP92_015782 [Vanilla planifolia]
MAKDALQKLRPYVYMVLLQVGFAGMYVISTATLKRGMNHYVLVVYRNLVAIATVAPFAFWFERKKRPKVTPRVFLKILAMAILEPVMDQNFYYMGAKLTNASFAAALYNVLPTVTFALALILRIEKLDMKRRHSQAKVIGAVVTVAGALLMILYNGPVVEFVWSKGRSHQPADEVSRGGGGMSWLKGTFMLLVSCVSWSSFFIVQSNTLESYPAELSLTTLICVMGALLSATVALVMERGNVKPWVIGWDTRLFTAVYSGIVCSGVAFYVQGMVMKERGPVFATAFNPLCMIITALMGSIILAEDITLGRIIGAGVIVIGLYSLIWGKGNDHLLNVSKSGVAELPVAEAKGEKQGLTEDRTVIEISTGKASWN